MRKLHLMAVIALLGMISLSSCKKDSNSDATGCTNTTNWVKNGHQFVYTNEPIYIFADSLTISFTETSTGSGIFKNTTQYDNGGTYPSFTNYIQPCGNNVYQSATADMANRQEAYRLDGAVNDTWTLTSSSTGGYTVTTVNTIAAKNVSVTVPAGTFSCLQLHSVSTSSNPLSGQAITDTYLDAQYGPVKILGNTAHYELARANY